jgi:hypothetical protein
MCGGGNWGKLFGGVESTDEGLRGSIGLIFLGCGGGSGD